MRSGKVIETIGSITKIEHLTTVRSNILPDTLVLRNSNPFPGYKQQENNSYQKPVSIFLILRYRYAPEKIKPGGFLVLESSPDTMDELKRIMRESGLRHVCIKKDLAGNDRVIAGRLPWKR